MAWTKFLFNNYNYNIYETFVVNSLIMAEGMLFYTLQIMFNGLFPCLILLNEVVLACIVFAYLGWTIGQFYGGKRGNYFKALLSYILGTVTFQVFVVLIGAICDAIIKV